MKIWLFLIIAIVAEVTATSALKVSEGFTKLFPSIIVVTAYAVSFYFLSLTLKSIPMGIAYAIWAGLGIVLVAVAGIVFFGQKLDVAAVVGMGLILAGVLVMNLLSHSVSH
jgi:small multidrug resistance pump